MNRSVMFMTVVNHLGYLRRSKRGRALKLDVSLEAFLLADRYSTPDGREWVNMVVPIEKVLDVLEGKAEAARICQLERAKAGKVSTEGTAVAGDA